MLILGLVAVIVLAWGQAVTRGYAARREWVPLAVFGGGLVITIALSPFEAYAGGLVGDGSTRPR